MSTIKFSIVSGLFEPCRISINQKVLLQSGFVEVSGFLLSLRGLSAGYMAMACRFDHQLDQIGEFKSKRWIWSHPWKGFKHNIGYVLFSLISFMNNACKYLRIHVCYPS